MFILGHDHRRRNALSTIHMLLTSRCVSHKEKFLVVSHKGTVFFPCGIFRKSNISHRNSEKCLWDGSGVGCKVALPNPRRREVG